MQRIVQLLIQMAIKHADQQSRRISVTLLNSCVCHVSKLRSCMVLFKKQYILGSFRFDYEIRHFGRQLLASSPADVIKS